MEAMTYDCGRTSTDKETTNEGRTGPLGAGPGGDGRQTTRERIEKTIAIFESMRELDLGMLREEERETLKGELESLLKSLPRPRRRVTKTRKGNSIQYYWEQKRREILRSLCLLVSAGTSEREKLSLRAELRTLLIELPLAERKTLEEEALSLTRKEKDTSEELEMDLFFDHDCATEGDRRKTADQSETVELDDGIEEFLSRKPSLPHSEPEVRRAHVESEATGGENISAPEIEGEEEIPAGRPESPREREKQKFLVEEARLTDDPNRLTVLSHSGNEEVLRALLRNANVTERHLLAFIPKASPSLLRNIFNSKKWLSHKRVRESLLLHPSAPAALSLELLGFISGIDELCDVLKNPKFKNIDAKARAKGKLLSLFRSMGTEERARQLKRPGSLFLLRELADEIFRDEGLLQRIIDDRSTEPVIILRIAQARKATARTLAQIAQNPKWTAHYDILLELVQNPKTPRDLVSKLATKLRPLDKNLVPN